MVVAGAGSGGFAEGRDGTGEATVHPMQDRRALLLAQHRFAQASEAGVPAWGCCKLLRFPLVWLPIRRRRKLLHPWKYLPGALNDAEES